MGCNQVLNYLLKLYPKKWDSYQLYFSNILSERILVYCIGLIKTYTTHLR